SNGTLGFPVNTGQKFGSGTATLNIKAWPSAVVRPELRYDRATLAAFRGKKDQVSVALAVAYLYWVWGAGWGPVAVGPSGFWRKKRYSRQMSIRATAASTENAALVS